MDVECLLMASLNQSRSHLYTWPEKRLTPQQVLQFTQWIQKRLAGHPIAHLIGYKEFWGLPFQVSPDTLIPRPDTETLVEIALEKIAAFTTHLPEPISPNSNNTNSTQKPAQNHQAWLLNAHSAEDVYPKILDLGTGTGAIACAIKSECPECELVATELNANALKLAQLNAQRLNLDLAFYGGSWFDALPKEMRFDIIVSNPPYIEEADPHLTQGDLNFEPRSALTSGKDGLDDIRCIIQQAYVHLNEQGWLCIEHGYNQAEQLAKIFDQQGYKHITTRQDLNQNDRVTLAQKPAK